MEITKHSRQKAEIAGLYNKTKSKIHLRAASKKHTGNMKTHIGYKREDGEDRPAGPSDASCGEAGVAGSDTAGRRAERVAGDRGLTREGRVLKGLVQ